MDERAKKGGRKMTVLQKIKVLERYVSVDPSMIDSVMEMAIDKLLDLLPTEWVESASNMLQVLFYQGLAAYGSL